MPATQREGGGERPRDPQKGRKGCDSEPQIPDHDEADLEHDQADSGPDRDHKDLGR